MSKYLFKLIISICIMYSTPTTSLAMLTIPKLVRVSKYSKNNYSYVQHRQAEKTEDSKQSQPEPIAEPLFIFDQKESDTSFIAQSKDSPEKEPLTSTPSKNIFSRAFEFFSSSVQSLASPFAEKQEIALSEQCILKQLPVTNQFTSEGGGYASCGYHALKNAIYLIQGLNNAQTLENIVTTLNNSAIVNDLFGQVQRNTVGKWRSIIMQQRALVAFKNYIYKKLELKPLTSIEENICVDVGEKHSLNKNKIREIFATLLNKYAQDAASALIEGKTTSLFITPASIVEFIQNTITDEVIKNIYDFINEEPLVDSTNYTVIVIEPEVLPYVLCEYLKKPETIAAYISISLIQSFELTLDNSKEVFAAYNHNNSNPVSLDGELLQEEEINTLKKLEKKDLIQFLESSRKGLLHAIDCRITIIDDINDLTGAHGGNIDLAIFNQISLKSQRGIDKAKAALENTDIQQYIHAFIIGTAQRSTSTSGHWFVLVLYKHNDMHEYLIMDSASNTNRLYDEKVRKVISLLEKQNLTEEATITPEKLESIEQEINSMINKKDMEVLELIERYKKCGGKEDFTEQVQRLFQN